MKFQISNIQALVVTTIAIIFFCLVMVAGCAGPSRYIKQLAKQGDFATAEVVTRKGERVTVEYQVDTVK